MYSFIQAMLGFAIMISIVAIIKPSLFHKIYGKLNRKHALAIFVGIFIVMNFTPLTDKVNEGAKREETVTNQQKTERDAAAKVETDHKHAEREAKLEFLSKIKLTQTIVDNVIGTPELHVTAKNGTDKTIDGLEFHTSFQNNFGEPVGKWGTTKEDIFTAQSQEIIKPGKTAELEWNLTLYEATTKAAPPIIDRVHFTDGTAVEMPQEE